MQEYDELEDRPGAQEHLIGHSGIPADARRLGLDRNTEEGAMIAMAGSLEPTKPAHRVVAWVLLAAFVLPLLAGVAQQLF
ncbi:MAG TPA: hypothetical protein VLA97_04750 [Nocardioidaceae bacterium]|nr:hypothetical protein [Nocardioidaceae bacterium]